MGYNKCHYGCYCRECYMATIIRGKDMQNF